MSEPNICDSHRPDDLKNAVDRVVSSDPAAELTVLHLIERYQTDVRELLRKSSSMTNIIASEPTYLSMAPTVGLDPERNMRDAKVFNVFRARIPTSLLKEILGDLHISINQYGPAEDHQTEESRIRFIAPLINRIVALFKLLIQNFPQHIVARDNSSKTFTYTTNRFKVFGAITIVLIVDRFRTDTITDRLNASALVISEAAACHTLNTKAGVNPPISAILCDGRSFRFFRYNGRTSPPGFARGESFLCSMDQNDPFDIPSFSGLSKYSFVAAVRLLSEVVYARFLDAYITGLGTHKERLNSQGKGTCPVTEAAIELATTALSDGVFATEFTLSGCVVSATACGNEAFEKMVKSVDEAPEEYRRDYDLTDDLEDEYYG